MNDSDFSGHISELRFDYKQEASSDIATSLTVHASKTELEGDFKKGPSGISRDKT